MSEMAMLFRLRELGFTPSAVLDIGAYKGVWTQSLRQIWNNVPVLMIEADETHKSDLEALKEQILGIDYRICALSDQKGTRIFHRMSNPIKTGSSFYRENSSRPCNEIEVECQTLDDLLTDSAKQAISLVKIDTQGSEIDVINGGMSFLGNVSAIMLELSLLDYNRSAPNIVDMMNKMHQMDFVLFDMCEESRLPPNNALIQVNGLFVPRNSPYRPQGILF